MANAIKENIKDEWIQEKKVEITKKVIITLKILRLKRKRTKQKKK